MNKTNISWTDATINCLKAKKNGKVGHYCEKVCVEGSTAPESGCQNCYASSMQSRFGLPEFPWEKRNGTVTLQVVGDNRVMPNGVELFFDDKPLRAAVRSQKPKRIFLCSMTDLFGSWVLDEWIDRVFAFAALAPQHKFLILTKRGERMRDYFSNPGRLTRVSQIGWELTHRTINKEASMSFQWPPPNAHLGVSVENQQTADERIPLLLQTPAAVRWISYEPALEKVDFSRWLWSFDDSVSSEMGAELETPRREIEQIIVGGESGSNFRPMPLGVVESTVEQCRAAGVKVFVKQASGRRPGMQGNIPDEIWKIKELPISGN
jgi:protein gp37